MPRTSSNRQVQDMYWFAHGGVESPACNDHSLARESTPGPTDTEDECSDSSSPPKATSEELPAARQSADQPDTNSRTNCSSKRLAVEERKRQILEAEQVKNEAILKKHAEREAALEARRNAQRNNISFAFGASVASNVEFDIAPVQLQSSTQSQASKATTNNLMCMSMTSSMSYTRGRRKNDLTPTIPYDRTGAPVKSTKGETRKRSVSMSRLDALAQPRKHYVEAQKSGSTMSSSGPSKDISSPKRPLSSASDKSNKSGRATSTVMRRPPTGVRKPRPVSIAGTTPDFKSHSARSSTPLRKQAEQIKKQDGSIPTAASSANIDSKSTSAKPSAPCQPSRSASDKPKAAAAKASPKPGPKPTPKSTLKQATPKTSPSRKLLTNKKQAAMLVATPKDISEAVEPVKAVDVSLNQAVDEDSQSADEKNVTKQHIISEEEARAALAEKRRLAREQAEKEAALLRQQEEEQERERQRLLREEEERQRQMEEEQLRLLEEHKRFEEEKLQKAIEEQERREEEEKIKREEEARLRAEQEKKAKEEAEKQRQELEEKLKKEEEERAERKKRLEKIMSRTRGKSGTASPSGSLNGSEPMDPIDNQPLSSEPSSLESNEPVERSSPTESFDVNQTLYLASQSLSSNDLMLPSSERTSLDDGSIQAFPSEPTSLEPHAEMKEEGFPEHPEEIKNSGTESASDQDQCSQSSLCPSGHELASLVDSEVGKVVNESEPLLHAPEDTFPCSTESQISSFDQAASGSSDTHEHTLTKSEASIMQQSYYGIDGGAELLPEHSGAFFQQVESESQSKLSDETMFTSVAEVSDINTAMSQSSQFFEQVESGSVGNIVVDPALEIATDREALGNFHENVPVKEIPVTSEVDIDGSMYAGVPGPFQDLESLSGLVTAENFEGSVPEENVLHHKLEDTLKAGLVDHSFSSNSENLVTNNEFLAQENIPSNEDAHCDLVRLKSDEEGVLNMDKFNEHYDESCESKIHCAENAQQQFAEDMMNLMTNEDQTTEIGFIAQKDVFTSSECDEKSSIKQEFAKPQSMDEISANVDHISEEDLCKYAMNPGVNVAKQEFATDMMGLIDTSVPQGDEKVIDFNVEKGESSNPTLLDSELSFQETHSVDELQYAVLPNPPLFSEDAKDYASIKSEPNEAAAHDAIAPKGEVPDHLSISQPMTESMLPEKGNNPFSDDVSKPFCDSMEVPVGALQSGTHSNQMNFSVSSTDNFIDSTDIPQYISQHNDINPFASDGNLSTFHSEKFMGDEIAFNAGLTDSIAPPEVFSSDSVLGNVDFQSEVTRTQNPFSAANCGGESSLLPPGKELDCAMDYIAEESEDSSLDSNLSQVLNVYSNDIAAFEEAGISTKSLPNGQSSDLHKPASFCDISADVPKANGCNGSTYDGRLESDFHADQSSDTSQQVHPLPDNGDVPSRNIFCLDDHSNSTKLVPNPFLEVMEGNPFSNNPF